MMAVQAKTQDARSNRQIITETQEVSRDKGRAQKDGIESDISLNQVE